MKVRRSIPLGRVKEAPKSSNSVYQQVWTSAAVSNPDGDVVADKSLQPKKLILFPIQQIVERYGFIVAFSREEYCYGLSGRYMGLVDYEIGDAGIGGFG
jgi:hypothetical protein